MIKYLCIFIFDNYILFPAFEFTRDTKTSQMIVVYIYIHYKNEIKNENIFY